MNIYFLSFRIFEQLALALKNTSCPDIFHCIEIFLSFRIFEKLALALKTEFALKFFNTGGGRPTASYAYACTYMFHLCIEIEVKVKENIKHFLEKI